MYLRSSLLYSLGQVFSRSSLLYSMTLTSILLPGVHNRVEYRVPAWTLKTSGKKYNKSQSKMI